MSPMTMCVLLAVLAAAQASQLGLRERFPSTRVVNATCKGRCLQEDFGAKMTRVMKLKEKAHEKCVAEGECPTILPAEGYAACVNGHAGVYPCNGIDLLSFVPVLSLGSKQDASDIWGYTDAKTGAEIAIINMADGTSFVDVSNPALPRVLGFLPTHAGAPVIWRDIKVYQHYAYIVSESTNHGMQVFDLDILRDLEPTTPVRILDESAFYGEFGSAHNIVINEETGFAYAVGTKTCRGGLHIVDLANPAEPTFAACFDEDGYTHDAQCVVYNGPDKSFVGQEICFAYNENTLTIVDVTDKDSIKMVARIGYENVHYSHQGWLTEDSAYLLLNDELDEINGPDPHTRTLIWDVRELTNPVHMDSFMSEETAVDHNLYIKGNRAYLSNYCAGLRVMDVSNIAEGTISEAAFFDLDPDCSTTTFRGTWSNYPYFKSGTIIVSSIERGLFLLRESEEQIADLDMMLS